MCFIFQEFDHPHLLLQNTDGFFSRMVEQTGKAMSDVLHKVAAANYNKRSGSQRSGKNKTP